MTSKKPMVLSNSLFEQVLSMRRFYLDFPIQETVSLELSWGNWAGLGFDV